MGYLHIKNLDKWPWTEMFREVYALEKIHGTSAHVSWSSRDGIKFFSGGSSHERFRDLFSQEILEAKFLELTPQGLEKVTVYGEAYAGRMQGMKATYGEHLRFIAFDVLFSGWHSTGQWLNVPEAETFVKGLGLEFVHYTRVPTKLPFLNEQRDVNSVQAIRNGMGEGHKREGIVIRPLIELTTSSGERLIAKYKREDFQETKTPRVVGVTPEVLSEANAVAEEWVTPMRLSHVADKHPEATGRQHTRIIIEAMLEDVLREGESEIVDSLAVRKAIGAKTSKLWALKIKNS